MSGFFENAARELAVASEKAEGICLSVLRQERVTAEIHELISNLYAGVEIPQEIADQIADLTVSLADADARASHLAETLRRRAAQLKAPPGQQ